VRQARNAAVTLFYGYSPAHVRARQHRLTPLKQYLGDMLLLLRLVLSLRRVGTSLPMHLYLSGDRHAKYERLFEEQGVHLSDVPYVNPAHWANPWHAGTFAKLHALALAAFDTVLVLDLDCVVLRNIDHVVAWPTRRFGTSWHARGQSAPGSCSRG
jgi:alpha-N-acetylglucosamine transferase